MNAASDRKTRWFHQNKVWILIFIFLIWGVVLIKQFSGGSREFEGPGTANKRSPFKSLADDPVLLASKLGKEMPLITPGGRNIFDTHAAAPPAPEVPEEGSVVEEPQPVCGNQACEAGEDHLNCPTDCQPPPPPPPPPIALRYIGYLSQRGSDVAFLTDGKEIYLGRVNDIIANKYRVIKITEEVIELGYLNLNQTSTIPFQGNQGG